MRKADNLTTILCGCHEIWEPKFVEPSGPLQACNGTDLPFTLHRDLWKFMIISRHLFCDIIYVFLSFSRHGSSPTRTTWSTNRKQVSFLSRASVVKGSSRNRTLLDVYSSSQCQSEDYSLPGCDAVYFCG